MPTSTSLSQDHDRANEKARSDQATREINDRACALARIGAAVALGLPFATHQELVVRARAAGATAEEIVGTLVAVTPVVGTARVVAATPHISMAIGYDINTALEAPD